MLGNTALSGVPTGGAAPAAGRTGRARARGQRSSTGARYKTLTCWLTAPQAWVVGVAALSRRLCEKHSRQANPTRPRRKTGPLCQRAPCRHAPWKCLDVRHWLLESSCVMRHQVWMASFRKRCSGTTRTSWSRCATTSWTMAPTSAGPTLPAWKRPRSSFRRWSCGPCKIRISSR